MVRLGGMAWWSELGVIFRMDRRGRQNDTSPCNFFERLGGVRVWV